MRADHSEPRYDLSLSEISSASKRKRTPSEDLRDEPNSGTVIAAKTPGTVVLMSFTENRTREVSDCMTLSAHC